MAGRLARCQPPHAQQNVERREVEYNGERVDFGRVGHPQKCQKQRNVGGKYTQCYQCYLVGIHDAALVDVVVKQDCYKIGYVENDEYLQVVKARCAELCEKHHQKQCVEQHKVNASYSEFHESSVTSLFHHLSSFAKLHRHFLMCLCN